MIALITKKFIVPILLGTLYLLLDHLAQQASFDCLRRGDSYNEILRIQIPPGKITRPADLDQSRHIKERLPNPAYEVWAYAKGDWLEIISLQAVNNISPWD